MVTKSGTTNQIPKSKLRELTKLSPLTSMSAIVADWSMIAACIVLHKYYPGPLTWILAWLVISSRFFAFYSLIHDAIHFILVRDRKMNDLIATIFLGFPLFISVEGMRKKHFDHHKFLQSEEDPEMAHLKYSEFQYPKSTGSLLLLFLLDISGINFLYYRLLKVRSSLMGRRNRKVDRNRADWFLYAAYFILFAASVIAGFWQDLLIYWIIPYATLYQVFNRLRLTAEHFYIEDENVYPARSVIHTSPIGFFAAPHGLGYHHEHHLYPGIPFYNLPELHAVLMTQEDFRNNSIIERSYIDIFKKLVR